ncbi:MAG: CdaR family protein [Candidatus Berkelbacteria bacterium]|nr:CdaR family protein [Candidatus Berkelbacteria bacterium]MCR4306969.1 CdaR family protein [Candidatus Berkelbacteria bacterium]
MTLDTRYLNLGGDIQTLKDIWQGWLQFGVGDTTRWLYFSFDILLVAVILYLIVRTFNSRKNINYFSLIGLALSLLVISAYITLPGLHVLAQFGLVLLVIGLPLYLDDRWLGLFSNKASLTNSEPPYLNSFLIGFFSLIGSFLIVGLVSGIGAKTAELPSGVPLVAVNLPEGMAASFGSQVNTKIIVSAQNNKWKSLTADNFSATVDVAARGEGTYDLPVKLTSKIQDVTIVRINPSNVVVTVEPVIKKTVTVIAKFSGKAGNDLVPDEPTYEPLKVEARGPKSVLTNLSQAFIQVKLNGEIQKIIQKFSLVALNSAGEVIGSVSFNPTEVEATINLVKAGNLKTVGIRPITSGQPASGFWIKSIIVDPSVVTVTGSADQLANLTEIPTEPIPVAALSSNTTVSITLSLPSGVTIADGTSKISAKIDLELTSTVKTIVPEIEYDGLSSLLKVTSLTPSSVSVLVSGPSTILSNLADGTAKLKLSLSPYQSAGTYSITIKLSDFTLPEGISLVSYLPSAVSVVLENR